MIDQDLSNEIYLERCQEDVDQELSKFNWEGAQAIIDDMRARGFDHHADILRKVLLEAQFAYSEDIRYEPVEQPEIPELEAMWFEGTPDEYEASVAREDSEYRLSRRHAEGH